MPQCPQCRGDLTNNNQTEKWEIVFSTLTTTAVDLDTSTFEIIVLLDDNTTYQETLSSTSGVVVGDRTEYSWTMLSPGTPLSGDIEVDHETLGLLTQALTVYEQGAAA